MSTYNDPRCRVDNLRRFDEKQLFVLGAELYDPGNISCFMFFYDGRLQQNNEVFDKHIEGRPFEFRLGSEEFIDGRNMGIRDMLFEVKRPKKGCRNVPPNSTLEYEIELRVETNLVVILQKW